MRSLGTAGRLHVGAPVFRPTRLTLTVGDAPAVLSEHPIAGSGYAPQLVEVMGALRQGRLESAVMPLAETVAVMRTMDLVRASLGLKYPQESCSAWPRRSPP